jgi:hypothetical protein
MNKTCACLLFIAAAIAIAGCKKDKPVAPAVPKVASASSASLQNVSVTGVTLGRMVGQDKKVTAITDTFSPSDTIYASVETVGSAPSASLVARWTYQDGQTVHEETQTIMPTGAATTEFHIMKPDGWPAGSYTLEIMVNGVSAQTARFRVG